MDIQQLRYVVALGRELHFSRAAQSLRVTQPTLSQQVKKLEEELGKPLFERSPHQVKLTAAGKKFLPYAVSILEQMQKAAGEVHEETGVVSGVIQLGVIPTICPYLMPAVVMELAEKFPKLKLEIYEETTSMLLGNLKDGKLDMGILALPVQDKSLAARRVGNDPFYLAVAKNHPWAKKKTVDRKEIMKEKLLILQEGHCFGQQSLDFCKLSRRDPQVSFQGSSLTSVMALAAAGRGVTFVPRLAMKYAAADLKFIPLDAGEQSSREIGIIWRMSSPLDPARRALIDTVAGTFEKTGR